MLTGAFVLLVSAWAMVLPDPLELPVTPATAEVVQVKVAVPTLLVKLILVEPPLQTDAVNALVSAGIGLTVTTTSENVPAQVLAVGVTR